MKLKKSLLHHILTLHQFNFTQVLLCKPTINFGNVLNTELFASLRNAWDKPISYPAFWIFGQRRNAKKPEDSGYENEMGRKEWRIPSSTLVYASGRMLRNQIASICFLTQEV